MLFLSSMLFLSRCEAPGRCDHFLVLDQSAPHNITHIHTNTNTPLHTHTTKPHYPHTTARGDVVCCCAVALPTFAPQTPDRAAIQSIALPTSISQLCM